MPAERAKSSGADRAKSSPSPGEILERLQGRVKELEAQLADARKAGQDRPRLQDLSPDELALEAVGAAGDIIKAARQQANDLRQAASADAAKVRGAAQQALDEARTASERLRAEAEATRDTMMNDARASSALILERVREESGQLTSNATAEADEIRSAAQREAGALVDEAQRRLQAALVASDQATATSKEEGRRIVDAARKMADSLREEALAEARSVITEAFGQLRVQEESLTLLLGEASTLRTSVSAVLDAVRIAADSMAAEGTRAEAAARSYLATVAQLKADLQSRLGPPTPPN